MQRFEVTGLVSLRQARTPEEQDILRGSTMWENKVRRMTLPSISSTLSLGRHTHRSSGAANP